MSTTHQHTSLREVRALKKQRDRVEVDYLSGILNWAHDHTAGVVLDESGYLNQALLLGGVGCPEVDEFDVYELAAVLEMSADSCAGLVAKVLELHHRLPQTWARVVALEVSVWKAFKIAEATICLPPEGAAYVDAQLAFCAHRCSFAQIERTVEKAISLYDPAEAERRRIAAAESRHFDVHTDHAGTEGTVEVTGTLDLADALDLEQAVRAGAAALAEAGCEESLDVRRSLAVGGMARGQAALPIERAVTIYAHLDGTTVATLDNTDSNVLITQIQSWCGPATKVTIKPVIDLNARVECPTYVPSERLREQVQLRDKTCVFPSCHRPARACDLDHVHSYACGGLTASDNLAPLCRRHHRTKTHTRWRYHSPSPGLYHWTSPHGLDFTVDRRP